MTAVSIFRQRESRQLRFWIPTGCVGAPLCQFRSNIWILENENRYNFLIINAKIPHTTERCCCCCCGRCCHNQGPRRSDNPPRNVRLLNEFVPSWAPRPLNSFILLARLLAPPHAPPTRSLANFQPHNPPANTVGTKRRSRKGRRRLHQNKRTRIGIAIGTVS